MLHLDPLSNRWVTCQNRLICASVYHADGQDESAPQSLLWELYVPSYVQREPSGSEVSEDFTVYSWLDSMGKYHRRGGMPAVVVNYADDRPSDAAYFEHGVPDKHYRFFEKIGIDVEYGDF